MENVQNTYINLFKVDRTGIGSLPIIAPENIDEAISIWCKKAIECLNKPVLTAEEEDFYYDFIELFIKNRYIDHPDFIEFKTLYIQKLINAINSNKEIDSAKLRYANSIKHKHGNSAAFMDKHGCLSDMLAAEELILILVNGKDFNKDRIKVRFDTLESNKTSFTYSAKNNELVIDHSIIYEDFDMQNPMVFTLNRLYSVLCLVEKKNLENEMNHDITLNALLYTIEKNYRRAFRTKAFDLMIETPMIEYHTKENVCSYICRSELSNPSLTNRIEVLDLIASVEEDLRDARHYTPSILQTYGSNPIDSNDAITTELTTRSLISLRANPKSMPTEVKRLLFLDGELKTFYQLKKELENLESVRSVMTPVAYETAKSEKAKILDYLTTYCIPLKIERIVHLINANQNICDEDYIMNLYSSLFQLRQDYPNEYETAVSILKNRLNKLNSYCASSPKVHSYFDEIFSIQSDLKTIESVQTYTSQRKDGLVDVSIDTRKLDTGRLNKIVYELQKITGKGVHEIMEMVFDSETIDLMHNVSEDLAKQYTSSKFIKKGAIISK